MALLLRNLRVGYDTGRDRRNGAVVPYSNNQEVLPSGNGRQYHRRIVAPRARVEVETTRHGKITTYYFDDGYAEEETGWEE